MDKTILIIDDDNQHDSIAELEDAARKRGINLTCHEFNVGSPDEPELLTEEHIDVEKVKKAYKERFKDKGVVFNMIVCDWGLSDEYIDGAELLRRMGNECFKPKTPRILYSSLLNEKIEDQLKIYKEHEEERESVVKYLVSLIRSNYLDFVERHRLKETVLGHLSDSEDLDFLLEDTLLKYPDLVMEVGHGHGLEGRTFAEVAREIKNSSEVSYDFKRNIIQEVMTYLTEKQSKKNKE